MARQPPRPSGRSTQPEGSTSMRRTSGSGGAPGWLTERLTLVQTPVSGSTTRVRATVTSWRLLKRMRIMSISTGASPGSGAPARHAAGRGSGSAASRMRSKALRASKSLTRACTRSGDAPRGKKMRMQVLVWPSSASMTTGRPCFGPWKSVSQQSSSPSPAAGASGSGFRVWASACRSRTARRASCGPKAAASTESSPPSSRALRCSRAMRRR
mmetsp:Transcript_84646/g.274214  ORF Transcript_84646/g.274214 Transcript_84646/m.274214 type:complete len:213 (-) Transcript_84646:990-1628(-)